jgi:hypothetical protein
MTTTDVQKPDPKAAIAKAHREIAEENQSKAVKMLKIKLRELEAAKVVVENVTREISELELKIEQGNI